MEIENAEGTQAIISSPELVRREIPLSDTALETRNTAVQGIRNILDGTDNRRFVVLGPCSIHDLEACRQYALRLKALSDSVADEMLLVMRCYFEKPRTSLGWKGFINDPNLDGSHNIGEGLRKARNFLIELGEIGIPVATEALDPLLYRYIYDCVSWACIGARTVESQLHREFASGLSIPVGMKNSTNGGIDIAANAIISARHSHRYIRAREDGSFVVEETAGNEHAHLVLRGGPQTNYSAADVASASQTLIRAGLPGKVVVDCSHGNSCKDFEQQPVVFKDCIAQIAAGSSPIAGLMLESHLLEGRQDIKGGMQGLEFGKSVTDGCISWESTEELVLESHAALLASRAKRLLGEDSDRAFNDRAR